MRKKLRISPLGFALVTAIALTAVVFAADRSQQQILAAEARSDFSTQLAARCSTLAAELRERITLVHGLAGLVTVTADEEAIRRNLDNVGLTMLRQYPEMRGIVVAPQGVIKHIYPLGSQNDQLINLDLNSDNRPVVRRAMHDVKQTDDAILVGPMNLRIGGQGFVSARRIVLDGKYWGVVVVIVDLPKVLQRTGFHGESGMNFVLRDQEGRVAAEQGVVKDPVYAQVSLGAQSWTVAAEPVGGWQSVTPHGFQWRMRTLYALLVLLAGGLTYALAGRQARLHQLVHERTQKVEEQLRFEVLVRKSSELLVGVDPTTLQERVNKVLQLIGEEFGGERVSFGELLDDGDGMAMTYAVVTAGPPFPRRLRLDERYPWMWRELLAGRPTVINSLQEMPAEAALDRKHLEEVGIRSQVLVPVVTDGKTRFGLAVASMAAEQAWPEESLGRLTTIARSLAGTIVRSGALKAATEYQEQLRGLARELANSEDQQRRELATILHDDIGQKLFAATLHVASLRSALGDGDAGKRAEDLRHLLGNIIQQTRELTAQICPSVLYEVGLGAALERLAELWSKQHGVPCWVKHEGPEAALPAQLRGLLYTCVRELLNNVAKHAAAHLVMIELVQEDRPEGRQLRIRVEDDGRGVVGPVRAKTGFGLFNIRERMQGIGGRMHVQRRDQGGTVVELIIAL